MQNKFVLASLTVIALTALSACGSTVQGAAVGGGVGQSASVPVAPSDISTDEDTGAPEPTGEETTDEETTGEETTEETTTEETTGGTGDVDLDACKAVTDFATAFANMLTKIQSGPISQEDVDSVFTDEVQAALPDSAQENYAKLKDLSNRLVGKSITELNDVATEITDAANDLQDIIKSACGVG